MASSEKQMIPLDAIPGENEDVPKQLPSKEDLVDVKFPSRPRRKVVIIAGVIAVLVVIIIAASLIGKYVPEYFSAAEDKSEKGSKGKGTGGPEESIPPSLMQVQPSTLNPAETKPSAKATIHQDQTWSLPEVKPSVKVISSDVIKQGHTSSLPKVTSLTSATSSTSTASIVSSVSSTFSASSNVDVAVIANLVPNTESKWTRWSSWSDCTKTCGTGSRQRTRKCIAINQRAVFAPISCAGKAKQVKSCAEWKCPDCSKNCTIGTLNAACDACTCAHHLLTGRVWTVDGIPLSEANISFADTPYNVLAQTNVSGHFSTLGVCANGQQEMLVAKDGFVPVKLKSNISSATTASITAKLEIAVSPFVTVHPKSKLRMPGQSVTFCCNGEGNPQPEIEWFKENNIIDKDLYNYDNVLEISDVVGLNGSFRCRVVNQFGSEFSTPAELSVLEKSVDSCSSKPTTKNETLPAGCAVNGTNATIVDVGECEPVTCIKGNSTFNSSCTDPPLCCGPRSYEKVLVQCGEIISFDLSIVKTCGCGKCIEKETMIQGIAVGQDDRAAKSVDVFFAEKSVDTTDENGKFSFVVPKDTRRAIVTFKDQTNNKFQEEDKTFIVNEGQTVQYRVMLREKPKPITFNASEPLVVPLGGETDSFADLELPENALLNEDGSVFSGNAKASVSVTDPRNQSDVSSAPGDFSSTSEDGEEEMLETFGMMKLNLEDDSGKPLTMSKPMKVYLDPEKLNISMSEGNVSVKLYWLDRKTGRWREAGDLFPEHGSKRRRKRSNRIFLTATVDPSKLKHTLNLDTPSKNIGLRVTTDKKDNEALVRVICKDQKDGDQIKGYVEESTSGGVKCVAIWRNAYCNVLAKHNSDSKYYVPDGSLNGSNEFASIGADIVPFHVGQTVKAITFYSKLEQTGTFPLYRIENKKEKEACEAPYDDAPAKFSRFEFKSDSEDVQKLRYNMLSIATGKDKDPDWSLKIGSQKFECFIEIKTATKDATFMAVSYMYQNDSLYHPGDEYGLHVRESKGGYVCLQIRCPGDSDIDNTTVFLMPIETKKTPVTCKSDGIVDSNLQSEQGTYGCQGFAPNKPTAAVKGGQWLCINSNVAQNKFRHIAYQVPNDSSGETTVERCEKQLMNDSKSNKHRHVNYTCS